MKTKNYDELFQSLLKNPVEWEVPVLASRMPDGKERALMVRELFAESRALCRTLHDKSTSGFAVAETQTRFADRIVTALYTAVRASLGFPQKGFALFALGGYGRNELSPFSDLDMLLLYEKGQSPDLMAQGLLYPLWDAGIDVQCVARTIPENIEVCRADSRSRTNLLEGRFLIGDAALAKEFFTKVLEKEIYKKGFRDFAREKMSDLTERHERYGNTVYLSEPNLKEGEGGLRDAHTAFWLAKLRTGVRSVHEIAEAGIVPPSEIEALESAMDFVLRIRNFLHYRAGRRDDRLVYEAQEEAAEAFGYLEKCRDLQEAADLFLSDFYVAANQIKRFSQLVVRRVCRGVLNLNFLGRPLPRIVRKGIFLHEGELDIDPYSLEKDPLILLTVFSVAQRESVPLSPQALHEIYKNLHRIDDRFRRDPQAIQVFLEILKSPRRVSTTLLWMHDAHVLDRFIPELAGVYCLVTREMNHVYPVDVHSVFTVQQLRKLARGEYAKQYPLATRVAAKVQRADILYLTALLHDVGKGKGADHSERGAEMAQAAGSRMGFGPEDLATMEFLVRNHLALSFTAQGRDLADEELILQFARSVGTEELLDLLFLLTMADVLAVGPGVLSTWKLALFDELYAKAAEVIAGGAVEPPSYASRAAEVAEQLRKKIGDGPRPLDEFLAGVDHPRYLLTYPTGELVRHLDAFARREGDPVVEIRHNEAEGFTEVMIVTRDRTGLFADLAGVTAAHRLNILSADLNTRSDGWVIDLLRVTDDQGELVKSGAVWEAWRSDLASVIVGKARSKELLLGRVRRCGIPPARLLRRRAPRIRFDNESSSRFTIVDITAPDRIGLLHDIASALSAQGLNLRLAKIATTLEVANDSFYVEKAGAAGKIQNPHELAAIRQELETAMRSGDTATCAV